MIPLGLIHGAFGAVGVVGTGVFGTWLTIFRRRSPWHQEHRRRQQRRSRALEHLQTVEAELHAHNPRYRHEHSRLTSSLQSLISDCRTLAPQHQDELRRLAANAEAAARLRHLRLHLLADAEIQKIGAGRKQTLAAHGVCSAADIDEWRILTIRGFGTSLTSNLLTWKQQVLQQFRFDPMTGLPAVEQRSVVIHFRARQSQILATLHQQLGNLESLAPTCRSEIKSRVPQIRQAVRAWKQAEADFLLLKVRRQ